MLFVLNKHTEGKPPADLGCKPWAGDKATNKQQQEQAAAFQKPPHTPWRRGWSDLVLLQSCQTGTEEEKGSPRLRGFSQPRCRGPGWSTGAVLPQRQTLKFISWLFHECPECSITTGKQHWPVITRMFIQKDMNCKSACTAAKNRVLFT